MEQRGNLLRWFGCWFVVVLCSTSPSLPAGRPSDRARPFSQSARMSQQTCQQLFKIGADLRGQYCWIWVALTACATPTETETMQNNVAHNCNFRCVRL
eukprot:17700-Amphidinium_carterae.1